MASINVALLLLLVFLHNQIQVSNAQFYNVGPNYGCMRFSDLSEFAQNFSLRGQPYSIWFSFGVGISDGFSGEFVFLSTNTWEFSVVSDTDGNQVLKYRVISSNDTGTFLTNPGDETRTYAFAVTESGIALLLGLGCDTTFPIPPILEENTFLQIGDCTALGVTFRIASVMLFNITLDDTNFNDPGDTNKIASFDFSGDPMQVTGASTEFNGEIRDQLGVLTYLTAIDIPYYDPRTPGKPGVWSFPSEPEYEFGGTDTFSIEVVFSAGAGEDDICIISVGANPEGNESGVEFGGWGLFITPSQSIEFRLFNSGTYSCNMIVNGAWRYTVVIVYHAGEVSCIMNGQLQLNATLNGSQVPCYNTEGNRSLTVFGWDASYVAYGYIGAVRFYNMSLTLDDALNHINGSLVPEPFAEWSTWGDSTNVPRVNQSLPANGTCVLKHPPPTLTPTPTPTTTPTPTPTPQTPTPNPPSQTPSTTPTPTPTPSTTPAPMPTPTPAPSATPTPTTTPTPTPTPILTPNPTPTPAPTSSGCNNNITSNLELQSSGCEVKVIMEITVPRIPSPAELNMMKSSLEIQLGIPPGYLFIVVQDHVKRQTGVTLLVGILQPESSGTTGVQTSPSTENPYLTALERTNPNNVAVMVAVQMGTSWDTVAARNNVNPASVATTSIFCIFLAIALHFQSRDSI